MVDFDKLSRFMKNAGKKALKNSATVWKVWPHLRISGCAILYFNFWYDIEKSRCIFYQIFYRNLRLMETVSLVRKYVRSGSIHAKRAAMRLSMLIIIIWYILKYVAIICDSRLNHLLPLYTSKCSKNMSLFPYRATQRLISGCCNIQDGVLCDNS